MGKLRRVGEVEGFIKLQRRSWPAIVGLTLPAEKQQKPLLTGQDSSEL